MLGRLSRVALIRNAAVKSQRRILVVSCTDVRIKLQQHSNQVSRSFSSVLQQLKVDGQSNEDKYYRLTPIQHVLLRPGMYIGPTERISGGSNWVLDVQHVFEEAEESIRLQRKDYGPVPALIKVFDEILINALDNRIRNPESCTRIDVTIDPGSDSKDPLISISNNGDGIPIEIHKTENMYIPELIFGNLLTGSNFDDTEKRVTGGRHGYGAKLTNIFSKKFIVETVDASQGLRYQQTWKNNMSTVDIPIIEESLQRDYTRISFIPDIPLLTSTANANFIDPKDYAIMCRRVIDIAGCSGGKLKVTLNGRDIKISSFGNYSGLYRSSSATPLLYSRVNDRWEICIGLTEAGTFESVSFVNGIATSRGGTHVNYIVQQVSNYIIEAVVKGNPEFADSVSPAIVRRHLFVTCNALIENPSFDSQMKESLASPPSTWGSDCNIPKSFLRKLLIPRDEGGPGIIEEVIKAAKGRNHAQIHKALGSGANSKRIQLSIPKLEDAHFAGTNDSLNCTLILTEGDSAKALAVAGMEVIGRSKFGVFPLRGKFVNVRKAKLKALAENAEFKALCSIIGLDPKKEYGTIKERAQLRYGHVMLMTDQDNDGSHIKGLVINFFRHFWPKILEPPLDNAEDRPFLSSFITPLIKATNKKSKEILSFYSISSYKNWRSSFTDLAELRHWKLKYYKGLGTSTPAEAKEYFAKFAQHIRKFRWNSVNDGELLDMVFDEKRADDRRNWMLDYRNDEVECDFESGNETSFENFVNNEMIHFSNADNLRSLPSSVDGLKPSQRKVLFACFKRNLQSEIKVAQLTGYCAEHTAYHHGEASLQSTIIGMAQDFVGSNNINLLLPLGQFGTRLVGGRDAASPRYIYTMLSPEARLLFPEEDDVLYDPLEDDGELIEPLFFCPIIPLLLVNGTMGIGTGWSTVIPPHNPKDLISYIRAKLNGEKELPALIPWARGFKGRIQPRDDGKGYLSIGSIKEKDSTTLSISELPLGFWTNTYKKTLIAMRQQDKIVSFVENHTTTSVSFEITCNEAQMKEMTTEKLEKRFKLTSNLSTTNMHAFDASNAIIKFRTAEEIADSFFPIRHKLYVERKSVLLSKMRYTAAIIKNKSRFIEMVSNGSIDLVKQKKKDTIKDLVDQGFDDMKTLKSILDENLVHERRSKASKHFEDDNLENSKSIERNEDDGDSDLQSCYDYLLNMPLSFLNVEKINELLEKSKKAEVELQELINLSPEDLWRMDLDRLEAHLNTQSQQ
jgi:DNA topoisomerase II